MTHGGIVKAEWKSMACKVTQIQVQTPVLQLTGCVTLDKSLTLTASRFAYL